MVVPVAPLYNDYARFVDDLKLIHIAVCNILNSFHVHREVVNVMKTGGFCVEADVDNGNTMNKKVRNAQLAQFNFIFGELYVILDIPVNCKFSSYCKL